MEKMCLFMFMRFLFLLSSFYLVMANSNYSSASSSMQQPLMCHDSESSALLQFKQSFLINQYASGDPSAYPKVATWKSHREGETEGSDCCSWDGVECDRETGHVIGLHLASSCLYGSIKSRSTLFNLLHLRRLDLSDNDFNYSQIPSAVGQLSRLRSLNLSASKFYGQIPSELLALSELVFLDLSGNIDPSGNLLLKLQMPHFRDLVQNLTHLKVLYLTLVDISSTIPHELANLSSLTALALRECGLHGEFPMNIFRLPSLQVLSVRYNPYLIGYLPEFQEASQLKVLYLAHTSFSGELPTSIGRLGSLIALDINSCNFTGLVPSLLGHLPQLSYLDLSNNSFSGQIPSSLANLTVLTVLDLSLNDLNVGTFAWLGQLTKVTALYLGNMNLSGEIPSSFANMSELSILNLQGNQLNGQIPSWLMNLTQLTELHLPGNQLEGSIPSSLFELENLETLSLHSNYLNGTLELHMLCKLKNLTQLQLSGNMLTLLSFNSTNATFPKLKLLGLDNCNSREFPDFLQSQDELEFLSLRDNNIHGPIPKWMWNISKETLEALFLDGNFLTSFDQNPDVLPWSRLYILALRSNRLQGPLPIPPPSTVQYLVSGNKLKGQIPPLICNMTSLIVLDLSSNNLSGRIPPCLTNFSKSLLVLDLGSNNFHGPIPEMCKVSNNLQVIDLGENQFEGQLPRSLANCGMLEHLVLGNNQIDDIFPFWLGALPYLKVLILRSNRFHGAIRSWHTNFKFPKLRIIDLSYNEFTGTMPSNFFKNLDAMRTLEVYQQSHKQEKVVQLPISTRATSIMRDGAEFPKDDHIKMMIKGTLRVYKNIPYDFMNIDLSSNKFYGEIPESIGGLSWLMSLNLSSNDLTGPIPPSLANLTKLEALDLSENMLLGEIPQQLTQLTFLAVFNVSHNNLTGPIPQGRQFDTFPSDSFIANPGLCGTPLSRVCGSSLTPTSSTFWHACPGAFNWEFVLMGYGSGLVIGVSIGYCLTSWKHQWFEETFGKGQRKRTRKETRGRRRG